MTLAALHDVDPAPDIPGRYPSRRCSSCNVVKAHEDYPRDATGPYGRGRRCSSCAAHGAPRRVPSVAAFRPSGSTFADPLHLGD